MFRRPASGVGFQVGLTRLGSSRSTTLAMATTATRLTDQDRYKTRENVFQFMPLLRYEAGPSAPRCSSDRQVRYSQTPTDAGTLVAEEAPIGTGYFGRVSICAGLAFDSRQKSAIAAKADYTDTALSSG